MSQLKKHKKNLLVSFTYMQYDQEERQINMLIEQIKELAESYYLKVNKITGCIEGICFARTIVANKAVYFLAKIKLSLINVFKINEM